MCADVAQYQEDDVYTKAWKSRIGHWPLAVPEKTIPEKPLGALHALAI